MVDRKARDAMSAVIQSWMDARIGSFNFDDTHCDIADKTEDESVRAVSSALWSCYSDTEDHKIRATKQEWDFLNRLRLILASDVEAEWRATGRRWDAYKTVSVLCLGGFALVAIVAGFGTLFFAYWILSGFLGLTILWFRSRRDMMAWRPVIPIFPFSSVKWLLAVRRGVPSFTRKRYPKPMERKAKLHRYLYKLMWVFWGPVSIVFAPLLLLLSALPIRKQEMRLNLQAECGYPRVNSTELPQT